MSKTLIELLVEILQEPQELQEERLAPPPQTRDSEDGLLSPIPQMPPVPHTMSSKSVTPAGSSGVTPASATSIPSVSAAGAASVVGGAAGAGAASATVASAVSPTAEGRGATDIAAVVVEITEPGAGGAATEPPGESTPLLPKSTGTASASTNPNANSTASHVPLYAVSPRAAKQAPLPEDLSDSLWMRLFCKYYNALLVNHDLAAAKKYYQRILKDIKSLQTWLMDELKKHHQGIRAVNRAAFDQTNFQSTFTQILSDHGEIALQLFLVIKDLNELLTFLKKQPANTDSTYASQLQQLMGCLETQEFKDIIVSADAMKHVIAKHPLLNKKFQGLQASKQQTKKTFLDLAQELSEAIKHFQQYGHYRKRYHFNDQAGGRLTLLEEKFDYEVYKENLSALVDQAARFVLFLNQHRGCASLKNFSLIQTLWQRLLEPLSDAGWKAMKGKLKNVIITPHVEKSCARHRTECSTFIVASLCGLIQYAYAGRPKNLEAILKSFNVVPGFGRLFVFTNLAILGVAGGTVAAIMGAHANVQSPPAPSPIPIPTANFSDPVETLGPLYPILGRNNFFNLISDFNNTFRQIALLDYLTGIGFNQTITLFLGLESFGAALNLDVELVRYALIVIVLVFTALFMGLNYQGARRKWEASFVGQLLKGNRNPWGRYLDEHWNEEVTRTNRYEIATALRDGRVSKGLIHRLTVGSSVPRPQVGVKHHGANTGARGGAAGASSGARQRRSSAGSVGDAFRGEGTVGAVSFGQRATIKEMKSVVSTEAHSGSEDNFGGAAGVGGRARGNNQQQRTRSAVSAAPPSDSTSSATTATGSADSTATGATLVPPIIVSSPGTTERALATATMGEGAATTVTTGAATSTTTTTKTTGADGGDRSEASSTRNLHLSLLDRTTRRDLANTPSTLSVLEGIPKENTGRVRSSSQSSQPTESSTDIQRETDLDVNISYNRPSSRQEVPDEEVVGVEGQRVVAATSESRISATGVSDMKSLQVARWVARRAWIRGLHLNYPSMLSTLISAVNEERALEVGSATSFISLAALVAAVKYFYWKTDTASELLPFVEGIDFSSVKEEEDLTSKNPKIIELLSKELFTAFNKNVPTYMIIKMPSGFMHVVVEPREKPRKVHIFDPRAQQTQRPSDQSYSDAARTIILQKGGGPDGLTLRPFSQAVLDALKSGLNEQAATHPVHVIVQYPYLVPNRRATMIDMAAQVYNVITYVSSTYSAPLELPTKKDIEDMKARMLTPLGNVNKMLKDPFVLGDIDDEALDKMLGRVQLKYAPRAKKMLLQWASAHDQKEAQRIFSDALQDMITTGAATGLFAVNIGNHYIALYIDNHSQPAKIYLVDPAGFVNNFADVTENELILNSGEDLPRTYAVSSEGRDAETARIERCRKIISVVRGCFQNATIHLSVKRLQAKGGNDCPVFVAEALSELARFGHLDNFYSRYQQKGAGPTTIAHEIRAMHHNESNQLMDTELRKHRRQEEIIRQSTQTVFQQLARSYSAKAFAWSADYDRLAIINSFREMQEKDIILVNVSKSVETEDYVGFYKEKGHIVCICPKGLQAPTGTATPYSLNSETNIDWLQQSQPYLQAVLAEMQRNNLQCDIYLTPVVHVVEGDKNTHKLPRYFLYQAYQSLLMPNRDGSVSETLAILASKDEQTLKSECMPIFDGAAHAKKPHRGRGGRATVATLLTTHSSVLGAGNSAAASSSSQVSTPGATPPTATSTPAAPMPAIASSSGALSPRSTSSLRSGPG